MVGPQPQGESLSETPAENTPVVESPGASQSNISLPRKAAKRAARGTARAAYSDVQVQEPFGSPTPTPPPPFVPRPDDDLLSEAPVAGDRPAPRPEANAVPLERVLEFPLSDSLRSAIADGREMAERERFEGLFGTGLLLLSLERIGRAATGVGRLYAPRFLAELIQRNAGSGFEAASRRFFEQHRLRDGKIASKPEWFSRNLLDVLEAASALPRQDEFIAARHVIVALLSFEPKRGTHAAVSAWEILADAGVDRRTVLAAFLESLARNGPAKEKNEWESLAKRLAGSAEKRTSSEKGRTAAPRGPLIPGYGADAPTGRAADDCLDLTATVDAMANLIASPELDGTMSLGVFGHWGSGKSFFMRRLRGAIDELTKRARQEASADVAPPYWPNVAQVEFNAWHYVDANLWASLMSHLLDVLRRWSPEEVKLDDATGLGRAIEKLEITSAAREHAVRRERAARKAKNAAVEALGRANRELETARGRLTQALASSLWSYVEGSVAAEREQVAAVLRELGLHAGDATQSMQPVFAQLRELTSTAGRLQAIVHQLLRSKDSGREVRRIAWLVGTPLIAVLIVSFTPFGEWLRNAGAVLATALAGTVAAAAQAAGWVQKHAAAVMDKLAPLMAIRSKIELELTEAESKRAKQIARFEQEVAACSAKVAAAAAEVANRDKEVAEAMQAVADAVSGRAVRQFIEQRLATGDYQKHLGLIATIRRDFEQLSDLIRAHNATRLRLPGQVEDIQRALRRARPDITAAELRDFFTNIGINRVVLYIDDLDRCPSNRVVEVLQAIHLLLSFPIFVVVVGVDSRWMAHSLAREYPALLTRGGPDDGTGPGWTREARLSVVTTSDYLEKIFQIPFWIPPLTAGAAQKMIGKLVASPVTADASRGRPPLHGQTTPPPGGAPPIAGREPGGRTPSAGVDVVQMSRQPADPAMRSAAEGTAGLGAVVVLRPEVLRVNGEEETAMTSLAAIIGRSPRATKRFVNSYRLLKAALTEAERRQFGIVDDQLAGLAPPMFLLAIVTGVPSLAAEFVAMLPSNPGASAVDQLAALADWAAPEAFHAEAARRIQDFARSRDALRWRSLAGHDLQAWVSRVTQFSFEDLLPAEGFAGLAPAVAPAQAS